MPEGAVFFWLASGDQPIAHETTTSRIFGFHSSLYNPVYLAWFDAWNRTSSLVPRIPSLSCQYIQTVLALKPRTSSCRCAASPAAASSTLSSTAPARSTYARPQLWPTPPSAPTPCSWQAVMPRPPPAQPLTAALEPPMSASRPSAERTASRCAFLSL